MFKLLVINTFLTSFVFNYSESFYVILTTILYYVLLDLFEDGEQVSMADSDEDVIEGEGCLVGEENVGAEDHGPRPALKQAHRVVRIPGENIYYWVKNEYLHSYTTLSASSPPGRAELVAEQELGKLDRTVEVRHVSRQPVHQQEDVAGPGHPVTQPRTLPQEPLPPDAGGGPGERRHVRLLAPHQPGPRQQRHRAARAVAPVHQLVTVLPRLLPLNKHIPQQIL